MAKGLRSTVKLRARNVKRTDPNGDFVKVQKQREAEIAARLAERKFQPTTSQLARLQDIQERKDADQEITQEEEEFLQSGGKVDVPQQPQDGTFFFLLFSRFHLFDSTCFLPAAPPDPTSPPNAG